jgi:hypothetical protein
MNSKQHEAPHINKDETEFRTRKIEVGWITRLTDLPKKAKDLSVVIQV